MRLWAFQCLLDRDALSITSLEKLLADPSVEIRALALTTLEVRGNKFTEDQAKSFLLRKKPPSLLGIAAFQNDEGRDAVTEFQARQEIARSTDDLEHDIHNAPFSSDKSYFALCFKQPTKYLLGLRNNFDNNFSLFFEEYITIVRKTYKDTPTTDTIERLIADSEKFWKRNWMRSALDIMVRVGGAHDLVRMRSGLDVDALDPRMADIAFLEKYGSFEDIARVCRIEADYRSNGGAAGILGRVRERRKAARSVLVLAKHDLVTLLASGLPADIIPSVIVEARQRAFQALSKMQLDELLFHTSDAVRKATALRVLVTNPVRSVREKLTQYQNAEKYRFYNVIFWLDLGVSSPIGQVKRIAKSEMLKIE